MIIHNLRATKSTRRGRTNRGVTLARGVSLAALLGSVQCTSGSEVEADISAQRGAQQPRSSGPVYTEAEACERMQDAVAASADRLNCVTLEIAECPAFIRPAGSLACQKYSSGAVDACVEQVKAYKSCGAFTAHPCLVSALDEGLSEGCVLPSPPDAGADGAIVDAAGLDAGTFDAGTFDATTVDANTLDDAGGDASDLSDSAAPGPDASDSALDAGDAGDGS